MASLLSKLRKSTTLEYTEIMEDSDIFNNKDMIPTLIPGLNIAYSASVDGGLSSGLHVWAGPSRHFKSLFCLLSAAAYLNKYEDAVMLFYDNEFGSPKSYFKSADIDPKRVIHSPFLSLEDLRTDISNQLNQINRGDKVIIVVDSLGMAASNKEIKDAEEGSEKADMTRAKVNKSLFRIVTPHLRIKDIPMIVVQHTYKEMCLSGETLIKTADGLCKISDIKVGDEVWAINGLKTVLNVYSPKDLDASGKEFFEMTFEDKSVIKCTHDHKFLMKSGIWKQACDITLSDEFY